MNNSESKQFCINTSSKVLSCYCPISTQMLCWKAVKIFISMKLLFKENGPISITILVSRKSNKCKTKTKTNKKNPNNPCFSIRICNKNEICRAHCLNKVGGITQMVKVKLILMCMFHLHPE